MTSDIHRHPSPLRSIAALVAASLALAGPAAAAPASATSTTSTTSTPASTPPAATPAEDPDALRDQAVARFKAKDYDGAVELFQRAHAVDPKPNYLFNIGRVYEEAGKLAEAAEYYQRFVREPGVDLESRELALGRLRVIREILEATEPRPEAQPPPRTSPEPEPEPEPESPAVPPRTRKVRIAGYVLLGVGAAAIAGGGVFGGLALRQSHDLENTAGYDARHELIDAGQTNAAIADGLFIGGGVLALAGLVMVLSTVRPKVEADVSARLRPAGKGRAFTSTLAPALGRGTVGLGWQGRF